MKDVKVGKTTLTAPKKTRDWMPLVLTGIALVGIVRAFSFSSNTSATILAGVVTIITVFQGEPSYKSEPWKRKALPIAYAVVALIAVFMSFGVAAAGNTTVWASNETAAVARAYWVAVIAALVATAFWLVKLKMDPAPAAAPATQPSPAGEETGVPTDSVQ